MRQGASGMYRPGASMIHGMNAAAKLVAFILMLAAAFAADNAVGMCALAAFSLSFLYLAELNLREFVAVLGRIWWFFLAVLLLNFFFYAPDEAFYRVLFISPSLRGLYRGLAVTLRLASILCLAFVLSSTTPALRLSRAVQWLLWPLSRLRLPTAWLALSIGLCIRLIPALSRDAENIRIMQRSRSMWQEKHGYLEKAAEFRPLLIPLVVSAFSRAEKLSLAMELRGFDGEKDSALRPVFSFGANDYFALLVCGAFCALELLIL